MGRSKRSRRSATVSAFTGVGPALAFGAMTMTGVIAPVEAYAADVNVTTNTNRVDLDTKSGTTVDIAAGVTIKNDAPSSTIGTVQATTQTWTLTNNGKIDGRQDDPFLTNDGVKFTKGGTINNTATGSITGFYGVFTAGSSSTVSNSGSITGTIRGVEMQAGGSFTQTATGTISTANGGVNIIGGPGSVINSGTITSTSFNGVQMTGGGTVENTVTGKITGSVVVTGAAGSITNAGTITGNAGADALVVKQGTITNTGAIIGNSQSSNAVSIAQTNGGVVTNSGSITNIAGKSFATGVSVTNGTFNNQAGGTVSSFYNAVYLPGSLGVSVLNNAGKLESTASTVGSGAVEISSGGTVTNESTGVIIGAQQGILVNGTKDITITNKGVITGTAAVGLQLNGTTKATVTNYGAINGGMNLNKGESVLNVFTGSSITGNVDAREGTDTLRLQGSGTGTYDSSYKNFEIFDVDAAGGTWTQTGTAAFTGGSTVTNGTLVANGTLTSTLAVKSGATLKGTGTVGATTVQGTVAPGNSIGQLNVSGDLTIQAGSTYQVEVDPTGAGDKIAATGAASITGGSLQVLAGAGKYNTSTEYVIITAPGGVSGSGFTGLSTNMPFLTPTVRYDPTQVVLTLKVSNIDFATIAQTGNQTAVGDAVQPLGPGNPIWDAILPLSVADGRTALNALSGEVHAAAFGRLVDDSRHVREAMMERLRTNADVPEDGAVTLWAEAFGASGDLDATTETVGTSRDIWGFFAGAERALGSWRVGILGGYQTANLDMSARASSANINAYHFGLYTGGMLGPISLRAGMDYSETDLRTARSVTFPGVSQFLVSNSGAKTKQFFMEAAWPVKMGDSGFEPFAGIGYLGVETDPIIESSGTAALQGSAQDADLSFSTLGLRGATGGGGTWSFRGAASWRHYFTDVTPSRRLTFQAGSTPFTVISTPLAPDAGLVEAGVEWRSGRTRISATYSGQFAEGQQDHGLRLTISVGLGG